MHHQEDIMPKTKKNLSKKEKLAINARKMREWRAKNREHYHKYKKEWRAKNLEKCKVQERRRMKKRRTQKAYKKYMNGFYERNREYLLSYQIKYRALNKEKIRKVKYLYEKEWIKNPLNKLVKRLRTRMRYALKGAVKTGRTMELTGCTVEELWRHLESKFTLGMTRENHGEWHVDHIVPCASFDLTKPEQQAKCFHHTNLQPLWALDNIKKGSKRP